LLFGGSCLVTGTGGLTGQNLVKVLAAVLELFLEDTQVVVEQER
jgi:hypothetical protein